MVSEDTVKTARHGLIINNQINKIDLHLARVLMEESLAAQSNIEEMASEEDIRTLLNLSYNYRKLKVQVALTKAMIDFATWVIVGGEYGGPKEDLDDED